MPEDKNPSAEKEGGDYTAGPAERFLPNARTRKISPV